MPNCPNCKAALRTVRQRGSVYFNCNQCGGRAVTVPQVRRVAGDRFATQLLHQINVASEESLRSCPFCDQTMKQFRVASKPTIGLNACKPCSLVWFEAGKFEEVPEGVVETSDELELRGREAFAIHQLEEIEEQQRREGLVSGDPPDAGWKWIPAFFGLPVKIEDAGLTSLPWLTWSLSAIITIVSVTAFFDIENAVNRFGLVPAEAWRYGGATFLTSFFLHGGIGHLVGNLYFLLLFGNNVEDYLGRWRFIGLVLLSTLWVAVYTFFLILIQLYRVSVRAEEFLASLSSTR